MELLLGVGNASLVEDPLGAAVTTYEVIRHLLVTSLGVVPEVSPHTISVRRVYPCELEPLGVSHPIELVACQAGVIVDGEGLVRLPPGISSGSDPILMLSGSSQGNSLLSLPHSFKAHLGVTPLTHCLEEHTGTVIGLCLTHAVRL